MIPLLGFAPDVDPTTPGVITECSQIIPTLKGIAGAPSAYDVGVAALDAECRGGAVVLRLDDQRRLIAGTQTKLYELSGATWTEVTRTTDLTTPGAPTGTGSGTGGTLAAATYYAKIVALDADGNMTAAGAEDAGVTTTGSTSSIAYTWTAVTDADSYRIYYGTTAGGEDKYYTSATNSYTLTDDAGTAGTPPASADKVDYTGGPENRWRFAQFGNATLATNQTDRIQVSTSGAFADIDQAPKARLIVTAAGFVVAFAIDDVTVGGDRPDAWWCSNIYDHLTWTPASSNQAAYGYLLDTPGEIRAAKRLGTEIAVYKERSIYIGRYVGPPVIWSFQPIPSDVGALSDDCVVDTGTEHLFIGHDDFWLFDGSRPRPIGAPVREWFFANSDPDYRYKTQGYFDRFTNRVWWFFCGLDSDGVVSEALIYNLNTEKWGRATLDIQAVIDYFTPETTFDTWPPGEPTSFEDIVDLSFDSEYFDTRQYAPGVFDTTNTLKTLNGPCASASLTTGDFGDDGEYSTLTKVIPRYLSRPTTATMTHYTKDFAGDTVEERGSSALSGNKFDALASGRFHSAKIDMTGDFELPAIKPVLIPDGEE